MTPDIQRSILRACARFIGKSLDPIQKRLDAMENKSIEVPLDGVVKELLSTEELKTLVDLHVAEAVIKHFEANPVQRGEKGEPGESIKGEPGADGVGLAGAVINRAGELVITKTNGEAVTLGPVIGKDGDPGKDGTHGLGFDDLSAIYDGERGVVLKFQRGEVVKEFAMHLPVIIDRGYWREGTEAKQGDAMTHDGTLWIALRDTSAKPARESDDWRIGARKGRDGLQGPPGKAYVPSGPVQLS